MQKPDWIELWIINRTIIMECSLRAIIRDVTTEHFGFWSFPEQPVALASEQKRIEALKRCVDRNLIKLYSDEWLAESEFSHEMSLNIDECDLTNPLFLERTQAIATLEGYAHWDAEFGPDWQRYWHTEGILDRSSEEAVVHIVYAGNAIHQELLRLLPDYLGADKDFGIKVIGYKTVFQYQVTKWKVLPRVKIAIWKMKIDYTLNLIAEFAKGSDEKETALLKSDMIEYFKDLNERQKNARRVLSRLSSKWDIITLDKGKDEDTIATYRQAEL